MKMEAERFSRQKKRDCVHDSRSGNQYVRDKRMWGVDRMSRLFALFYNARMMV